MITIPSDAALTPALRKLSDAYVKALGEQTDAQDAVQRLRGEALDRQAERSDNAGLAEGKTGTPAADELAKAREEADLNLRGATERARLAEGEFVANLRANRDKLLTLTLKHADEASAAYLDAIDALLTARVAYTEACSDYNAAAQRKAGYDRQAAGDMHARHATVPDAIRGNGSWMEHPTNGAVELQAAYLPAVLRHDAARHNPNPHITGPKVEGLLSGEPEHEAATVGTGVA